MASATVITTAPTHKSHPCYRCSGTGIYRWGAIVNGVSQFQGTCFRCNGNGIDPSAPKFNDLNSPVFKNLNDFANGIEQEVKYGTEEQARASRRVLITLLNNPVEGPYYAPNVYVALLESVDRVLEIRFGKPEAEVEPVVEPVVEPSVDPIPNGTYTIETEDGHFTFRIKPGTGKLEGRTIIEYLYGSDNELDFRAFGFVKADRTIAVWTRFQHSTIGKVRAQQIVQAFGDADTLEAAGQKYALQSGRCRRCGRTLTVPASINRGYGPDCAEKVQ